VPTTTQDTENISKTGPMIVVGLSKLRVLRQNPSVGSALPKANRVGDKATQRMASSWRYLGPHRGDPASSSFVSESWPGGFIHTPPCGLASSHPGSPDRDYLGMKHETTWPGFAPGGSTLVWSYEEVLAHTGSHPCTVTTLDSEHDSAL
jgi:hypothetical protein